MAQSVRAASRRSPVVRLNSMVSDSPPAAQTRIWSDVVIIATKCDARSIALWALGCSCGCLDDALCSPHPQLARDELGQKRVTQADERAGSMFGEFDAIIDRCNPPFELHYEVTRWHH